MKINKERAKDLKTVKKIFSQPPTPKNVIAQIEANKLCNKWNFTDKELQS